MQTCENFTIRLVQICWHWHFMAVSLLCCSMVWKRCCKPSRISATIWSDLLLYTGGKSIYGMVGSACSASSKYIKENIFLAEIKRLCACVASWWKKTLIKRLIWLNMKIKAIFIQFMGNNCLVYKQSVSSLCTCRGICECICLKKYLTSHHLNIILTACLSNHIFICACRCQCYN